MARGSFVVCATLKILDPKSLSSRERQRLTGEAEKAERSTVGRGKASVAPTRTKMSRYMQGKSLNPDHVKNGLRPLA
jgi:hypothetical protein